MEQTGDLKAEKQDREKHARMRKMFQHSRCQQIQQKPCSEHRAGKIGDLQKTQHMIEWIKDP